MNISGHVLQKSCSAPLHGCRGSNATGVWQLGSPRLIARKSPRTATTQGAGQVQERGGAVEYKSLDQDLSQSPSAAQDQEKFNWAQAWYPLAIESYLPTDRPTAHRLLGNAVVIWKDGEGQWRAFKDLCPHRLVALSEGRVENGNLMCSYHGWQFEGSGKLKDIPQADDAKVLERAIKSQRSCCQVYPCQVADGLIWVYGSCQPGAEAAAKSIPLSLRNPELEDPNYKGFRVPWYQRDVPYGADTLLENVLDPSHVPFAHHGIQGNRFDVRKMHIHPATTIKPSGFSVVSSEPEDLPPEKRSKLFPYTLSFTAPSLIRYDWNNGNRLITYAIPTDPGRSRLIFSVMVPSLQPKGFAALAIKVMQSKWFAWHDHFTRNAVLDGDGVFLCLQDQDMRKAKEQGNADRLFYMPSSLDQGVTALHKWLTNKAEAIPWAPGALDPDVLRNAPRKTLLDRFEQHTQHCPSCREAHQVFSNLKWVAAALAVVAAMGAAYSLGSGVSLKKLILPAVVVMLSGALARVATTFKGKMEFQDYRHPDH